MIYMISMIPMRVFLGLLGMAVGGGLGWLTRPQPSLSYLGAVDPNAAYMGAVLGHIGVFVAIGLVLGVVLGMLGGGKEEKHNTSNSKASNTIAN